MIGDDLKDVLEELTNISFGSATATIADLFDNFATLHVPTIDFVDLERVNEFIVGSNDNKFYVSSQQFKGTFHGEVVLVIDPESGKNMHTIIDKDEEFEENEVQQNILEISNILSSSCIGKLAEMLDTEVAFAPPSIDFTNFIIRANHASQFNKVIVISTILAFEELNINGKLIILFSDEMFAWLENALNDFMENI
ncbi:hypothetical protein [Desulfotalea psychrophila]|uniref:Chemotaxis protein CheC n=1 Tax=Desulfotalea psychrophila (strain LSv54 / DSM 12343) TaxID=177439 RepID=Q6AMZ2_DESPS|nr:hypothetical protein [Desulfotalea psychrophila]CAG36282.1 unknown protein [Desulfotalea psychrophila LSv54]